MSNTLKSSGASLTVGAGGVTVYTCPASTATTIISMTIANNHTVGINVVVALYKNGSTPFILNNNPSIPVSGTFVVIGDGQKLIMQAGDVLRVQTFVGPCDVILSYVEVA